MLAILYVTPYIPLLFTPIPFSATLEIMFIFLLGLVVIIPSVKGAWNEYSDNRILKIIKSDSEDSFCEEHTSECEFFFRKFTTSSALFRPSLNLLLLLEELIPLIPVLFLYILCITVIIASYFKERSNRKGFIQRKLVQVGADTLPQHNTSLSLTDFITFLSVNLTGSHKAQRRRPGEAEVRKR